jgi:transcriptional regulator with XRE-family HTH domain
MMKPRSFDDHDDFLGPYLGPVLVRARRKQGFSQLAVAEMVHVSDGTLRRIESGQGPMRPKLVRSICEALDLRLNDVVLEALFSFWIDFQKKAGEGGEDSSANPLGPYQRLRENILDNSMRIPGHSGSSSRHTSTWTRSSTSRGAWKA